MTKEQIKQIVKLTEAIVNKRLNEGEDSYVAQFKKWLTSQGLTFDYKPNKIQVFKNGKPILTKETNSFFRSSHLDSIANQIAKILNIKNTFTVVPTKSTESNRQTWSVWKRQTSPAAQVEISKYTSVDSADFVAKILNNYSENEDKFVVKVDY